MANRDVILKLAKVLIAVAWADGAITNEELNSLKDLLFQLPGTASQGGLQIGSQEWARLEMYMESPVGPEERARLVAELQNALLWNSHKELAVEALQRMIRADGLLSDNEKQVAAEVRRAIESAETGVIGGLQKLLGGAMERRSEAVANAPNRETFFEDFLKNKVYYSVAQRLRLGEAEIDISDAELRKLGLAGGLMAKVAHVDRQVSQAEFDGIVQAIRDHWQLNLTEATLVAEVAVSAVDVTYDAYRMMRELASTTDDRERQQFLEILFEVAAADGDMSYQEMEEIRLIAQGLNMSHREYIDAKLAVLGESRPGSA